MKFNLEKSFEIMERTPSVLETLLSGLGDEWLMNNEGEKTDWMVRTKMILEKGTSETFATYDRFAMYEESKGKNLTQLLNEFRIERNKNIELLKSFSLDETKLNLKGVHPKFGEVILRQLLSTWVIHDLTHIAQITRVMAKQYKNEMGPWLEYFRQMQ